MNSTDFEMNKEVLQRAKELFEKVKDSKDYEYIKKLCLEERKWLDEKGYKLTTLGKYICYYTQFINTIPPEDLEIDKNAYFNNRQQRRHIFFKYCSLTKEEWDKRNTKTNVINRMENPTLIDPDVYLKTTGILLWSDEPHKLTVGLIAATGRRPTEILSTAKFTKIEDEKYGVLFEGQLKKRGENPLFKIATLYPADFIIDRLNFLRSTENNQMLQELELYEVNDKRGVSINRVVKKYFSTGLPPRYGNESISCKDLRAAYGRLASKREYPDKDSKQQIYFGQLMGHLKGENPTDRDLKSLLTTMNYNDYYIKKDIPFPEIPNKDIPFPEIPNKDDLGKTEIMIYEKDIPELKEYQEILGNVSEAQAIRFLLSKVKDLKKTLDEMKDKQKLIAVKKESKPPEDFSTWSNQDLILDNKKKHTPGSAYEKIERGLKAIMDYNNYTATSNQERWFVSIRSIQALTGCRHSAVQKYVKTKQILLDDHNNKFGLNRYTNRRRDKEIYEVIPGFKQSKSEFINS